MGDSGFVFDSKRIGRTPYSEQWYIYELALPAMMESDNWFADGIWDTSKVDPSAWLDLHFYPDRIEGTLILIGDPVHGDTSPEMMEWIKRRLIDEMYEGKTLLIKLAYGKGLGAYRYS